MWISFQASDQTWWPHTLAGNKLLRELWTTKKNESGSAKHGNV